jgi:hypothetical protein
MGWSRHPESLTEKEASSSANADDPVIEAGVKENRGNLDAGYSAFAEYDVFLLNGYPKKRISSQALRMTINRSRSRVLIAKPGGLATPASARWTAWR